MAGYENDIFISYRRSDDNWVRWTRRNFVDTLHSLLRPSLGNVRLFVDDQIETGASWPNHLALKLSRSRIMVPVLSRDYFQSDWCRLELALMHNREQTGNIRTQANPKGIIIPVIIDDGDCFPAEIQAMQAQPLHAFANPFIRLDSPKQEEMAEIIKDKLCGPIREALMAAPDYDPGWEHIAHHQFEEVFKIHVQSQNTVPALILPNP